MKIDSQICNDWIASFPELSRFKKGRRLLRMQLPIVFGLELEKFSQEAYRPKFICMNLLSSFPEFSINRGIMALRHPQLSIPYAKHECCFMEAVNIMRKSFPVLAFTGSFSENDLIKIYTNEIYQSTEYGSSPLAAWFSLVQILSYFQRNDEADVEKSKLRAYVEKIDPKSLLIFGDFDLFFKKELECPVDHLKNKMRLNILKGGWDSIILSNDKY